VSTCKAEYIRIVFGRNLIHLLIIQIRLIKAAFIFQFSKARDYRAMLRVEVVTIIAGLLNNSSRHLRYIDAGARSETRGNKKNFSRHGTLGRDSGKRILLKKTVHNRICYLIA